MANPPGNHQQEGNHAPSSFNGAPLNNGNPIPETSGSGLKHNPGISLEWTLEEQAILEEGLKRFSLDSEPTLIRYAKIAMHLQNKTVRDVALRCRWMTKKENSKRRKEEHNLARTSKDRRERFVDTSAKATHFPAQPNLSPYPTPMIPMDYDDGIPCRALGGVTGELLEQNAKALDQICGNMVTYQVQDNVALLSQTRDNLLKLMHVVNGMPGKMKQMPPLPVTINHGLANTILGPPSHPMQQP